MKAETITAIPVMNRNTKTSRTGTPWARTIGPIRAGAACSQEMDESRLFMDGAFRAEGRKKGARLVATQPSNQGSSI